MLSHCSVYELNIGSPMLLSLLPSGLLPAWGIWDLPALGPASLGSNRAERLLRCAAPIANMAYCPKGNMLEGTELPAAPSAMSLCSPYDQHASAAFFPPSPNLQVHSYD